MRLHCTRAYDGRHWVLFDVRQGNPGTWRTGDDVHHVPTTMMDIVHGAVGLQKDFRAKF